MKKIYMAPLMTEEEVLTPFILDDEQTSTWVTDDPIDDWSKERKGGNDLWGDGDETPAGKTLW